MTFVNDDFIIKIIKKEIRDRKNKKKIKDIASTPKSSEDYVCTKLLNKKKKKRKQRKNSKKDITLIAHKKARKKKRKKSCNSNKENLKIDTVATSKIEKFNKATFNSSTCTKAHTKKRYLLNKIKNKKRKRNKAKKILTKNENASIVAGDEIKCSAASTGIPEINKLSEVKEEASMECLEFGTGTTVTDSPVDNHHVYFNKSASDAEERETIDRDKAGNAGRPVRNDSSKWIWDRYSRKYLDDSPYACDYCGETFLCSEHLVLHYGAHTGENQYNCPVCGQTFANNGSLIAHAKTHTDEEPLTCDVCSSTFSSKYTLIRHRKMHTGEKPYECDVCGKRFTENAYMVSHYRTHTGEKPYECNVCGKRFTSRGSLTAHYRTHTGEKPYECDVCGKRFAKNYNMVSHHRTHTGERPFECGPCDKSFASGSGFNYHLKRVHVNQL